MGAEVFSSHLLDETALLHGTEGLFIHMGEYQPDPVLCTAVIQLLHGVHGGSIQSRNTTHTHNDHLGIFLKAYVGQAVRVTEEHGTGDLIDTHMSGDLPKLRAIRVIIRIVVFPAGDLGFIAHPLHKEDHGHQHAYLDSYHQIEGYREKEGDHQHQDITLGRCLAEMYEGPPLTHIIGHHEQDGCDTGHGDHGCIRQQEHQYQYQNDGMGDTRDWGTAAVLHICCGSCDGACGGNTSKKSRTDISYALGDELHIGTMMGIDHTICHHTGKQGFNGRQDGYGEGIRQHSLYGLKIEIRPAKGWELVADLVQVSDGIYIHIEDLYHSDPHKHSDQGSGDLFGDKGPYDQYRQTDNAHKNRLPVYGGNVVSDGGKLVLGLDGTRSLGVGQAHKILDLPDNDGHGDTCGKAGGYGIRNEFDQRSKPQQTHDDQDNAGHDGGDHQTAHSLGGDYPCNNGGKGCRRPGDLHAASSQKGNEEAGNDRSIDTLLRSHAGCKSQCNGKRQCDDGYDDTCNDIRHQLLSAVMLHVTE